MGVMRGGLATIGLALGLCGASASARSSKELLDPVWAEKPSAEVVDRVVAELAPGLKTAGWVQLSCRIAADGHPNPCWVAAGDMDQGRDKVALALAQRYRLANGTSGYVRFQVLVRPVRSSSPAIAAAEDGDVEAVNIAVAPPLFRPRWTSGPTKQNWDSQYPAGVLRKEGFAEGEVDCTVTSDGRLIHCDVVSERPEGFGKVMQTIVQYYRMDEKTLDGVPVAGWRVRMPVRVSRRQR